MSIGFGWQYFQEQRAARPDYDHPSPLPTKPTRTIRVNRDAAGPQSEVWQVVPGSVYDGDTLKLKKGHRTVKIRLCGTDDFERARSRARSLTFAVQPTVDPIVDHVLTSTLNHVVTLDLTFAFSRARALNFAPKKIFQAVDLDYLVARLETLKARVLRDDQPRPARKAFVDQIYRTWFEVLGLERQWLDLSMQEVQTLVDYLYVNELMVRCKESAVRVSREPWQAIEQRMLIVD